MAAEDITPAAGTRFCKDCRWYRPDVLTRTIECEASRQWDIVTGQSWRSACQDMRREMARCGATAKLYEPAAKSMGA